MKTKRQVVMSGMAVAIVLIIGGLWVTAQETDPTDGRAAYQFEEIADGVDIATGTGVMTTFSNSLVIVNDDHAMLVDTSVSPAAARKLVAEIRTEVTDKPIRYVFNTHTFILIMRMEIRYLVTMLRYSVTSMYVTNICRMSWTKEQTGHSQKLFRARLNN